MKRYDSGFEDLAEHPEGEWVDFEDHQLAMMANDAALRDLQRQLADLTRERDTLRAMLELQNSKLERVAAVIERSGK